MSTKRILCVDDDESTCEMLTAMLGFSDLEAVSVPNAGAALRLMERERFDLYILDGQLPDVSGLSLCAQIREVEPDTPLVIFSGRAYQSDIDAGMRAGANAYLVKPNSSGLIATVKRLLEDAHNTPV